MADIRILVVEDEVITAMDIRNRLQKFGYIVPATAVSGVEALELVEKIQPDLVLMDIVLSGDMDGTVAAKLIYDKYKIPIVFLTAYSDEETFSRAKLSAPYGYLTKPFENKDLRIAVELALFKHEMNSQLMVSEARFQQSFNFAPIGMLLLLTNQHILQVNHAFCHFLGSKEEELLKLTLQDISHPEDLSLELSNQSKLISGEQRYFQMEKRFLHRAGHIVWGLMSVSAIEKTNNNPGYFIIQVIDITARKLIDTQLVQKSFAHSPVPSIQRHEVERFINQALIDSVDENKLGIIILGIENLIQINDTYGRKTGDIVLLMVNDILQKYINKKNLVSRLEGNKFIIILTEIETIEAAQVEANNIRNLLKDPLIINHSEIALSTKIGITFYPDNDKDINNLVSNTEMAFSLHEREEENLLTEVPDILETIHRKTEIQLKLKRAFETESFAVGYLPIANASLSQIAGLESEILWQLPNAASHVVTLDELAIAAEIGLLDQLWEWQFKSANLQTQKWQAAGFNYGLLHLTLLKKQLLNPQFLKKMTSLSELEFKPESLALQLKASILKENYEAIKKSLEGLLKLGYKLVLTHFDENYLDLLEKDIPIYAIKLTSNLTLQLPSQLKNLKSLVNKAHKFNVIVMAINVDTQNLHNHVITANCDLIQGFCLSQPLVVDAVPLFLQRHA